MRLNTRFLLLTLGLALVVTLGIVLLGAKTIDTVLYRGESRALGRALDDAARQVLEARRSRGMAAAQAEAARQQTELAAQEGHASIHFFVVDRADSRVLYHPSFPIGQTAADVPAVQALLRQGQGSLEYEYAGRPRFAIFQGDAATGWVIGGSLDRSEMFALRNEYLLQVGLGFFALVFLGMGLQSLSGRWLVRRIQSTAAAVARIRDGEHGVRLADAHGDELGELIGGISAMAVSIDERIAAQRQAEQAAVAAERRARTLLDQSLVGIYIAQDGRFRYVNRRLAEILGYTDPARMESGITVMDIVAPWHRALVAAQIQRRLDRPGEPSHYSFTALRADGTPLDVEVHGRAMEHEGRPAVIGALLDVTERNRVERELRENQRLLRAVLDNTTSFIFARDVAGRFLLCNQAFAERWKTTVEAITGRTAQAFMDPEMAAQADAGDQEVLRTGQATETMEELVDDLGLHTYRTMRYPLRDEMGDIYGLCSIATDVTDHVLAEAERRGREVAEASNRAKTAFLANMSHELRTPLNAILGYAQLLRREPDISERMANGLGIMEQSGSHLLNLINDLLDLSKIEVGKLKLAPAPLSLRELARSACDLLSIRAQGKGLALDLRVEGELPEAVLADEKQLRQVLLNLLGNALKFTDQGSVTLQISLLDHQEDSATLRFAVTDTGVGMEAQDLQRIFQPFEQVGDVARQAGGTGLGLAISRQLVRLMGGDIQVASTVGEGTCFWFELELPVAEAAALAAGPAPRPVGYLGRRRRVLVVDDVVSNRSLLRDLLGSLGFQVEEAADGLSGLQLALASKPDLVLLDYVMPGLNGREVVEALRERHGPADLPVLILSASAAPGQLEEAQAAGANGWLGKPVDQALLLGRVGELMQLAWQYEANPAAVAPVASSAGAPAEMTVPPAEVMEGLLHLARGGNMRGIRNKAAELAADERYAAFAERLRQLAAEFQSKAILNLIESHMAEVV